MKKPKKFTDKEVKERPIIFSRLPWRVRIFLHDCLIHPLAGLLWILGLDRMGYGVHNGTVPMYCRKCNRCFDAERCPNCGKALE